MAHPNQRPTNTGIKTPKRRCDILPIPDPNQRPTNTGIKTCSAHLLYYPVQIQTKDPQIRGLRPKAFAALAASFAIQTKDPQIRGLRPLQVDDTLSACYPNQRPTNTGIKTPSMAGMGRLGRYPNQRPTNTGIKTARRSPHRGLSPSKPKTHKYGD